jgi:transcriptional regulator with XRE-family HTH domain
MARIEIEPSGRFGTALKSAIEASDMALAEVAEKSDTSYEHLRKLISGKAYPSVHLLRILATMFKTDRDEWAELVESDKLHKKFKHLPKFLNHSPDLEPLQPLFPRLSKHNQEMVIQMVRTLLKQQGEPTRATR